MKKLHVHVSVNDLEQSKKFYTDLFSKEPDKVKIDYIKWDLDNPPVNFAISTQNEAGLDHIGIQVEDAGELEDLYQRIGPIDATKKAEGETVCCYARSVKTWIQDPQGINWELFHSLNDEEVYRDSSPSDCCTEQKACC